MPEPLYRPTTDEERRERGYGYGYLVCTLCGLFVHSVGLGQREHALKHQRQGSAVVVPESYFRTAPASEA
jgi:hypothetical protein